MTCFFIVGPPRSGTTLLFQLLGLHPEICAERQAFAEFHHDLRPLRRRETAHYRLTAADAQPEVAERYRESIVRALRSSGRPHFLLKYSTLCMQVDYVRAMVPDARFIHIVRDARDAVCSLEDLRAAMERRWNEPKHLATAEDPLGWWCRERFENKHLRAAASWFYHTTRSFLDLRFAGEGAYVRVRYEDLVEEPEVTFQKVLSFLGLPIHDAMRASLREIRNAPGATTSIGFSTTQARGPRRIERYIDDLSTDVRDAIAPLIESPMAHLGYAPDVANRDKCIEACRRLHINSDVWIPFVDHQVEWFSKQYRAFQPEHVLKCLDAPVRDSAPLLIDGASWGAEQRFVDGRFVEPFAWIQKQERRYSFPDPKQQWLRIVPKCDGLTPGHVFEKQLGLDGRDWAFMDALAARGFLGYL